MGKGASISASNCLNNYNLPKPCTLPQRTLLELSSLAQHPLYAVPAHSRGRLDGRAQARVFILSRSESSAARRARSVRGSPYMTSATRSNSDCMHAGEQPAPSSRRTAARACSGITP